MESGDAEASTSGTTGGSGSEGDDAENTSGSSGEHELTALEVYAEVCATCHGDEGEGNDVGTNIGPEIRHPHPVVAYYLIRNGDQNQTLNANGELVGHPGVMAAYDAEVLTDEVVDEILAWLDGFPKPTTGMELFADYCGYCHGTSGGSDTEYVSAYHNMPFTTSGNVNTVDQFIAYVREGHEVNDQGAPVPMSERRDFMPAFGPELVTDEELALMEAWVRQQ